MTRLSDALQRLPHGVRVEGHTDDMPIHTPQFNSNWELSTARATHVVQFLIQQGALAPERLSAAGYAEFHPVGGNAGSRGARSQPPCGRHRAQRRDECRRGAAGE